MNETQFFERPLPIPTPLSLGRIEMGGRPVANGGYLRRYDVETILKIRRRTESEWKVDTDLHAEETDMAPAIEELLLVCLCVVLWHMQKDRS